MKNAIYKDEDITQDDLYFMCYMIERVARRLHQRNKYVVNHIPKDELTRLISIASVIHSENPLKIEEEWIKDYQLEEGSFDITSVNTDLVSQVPTATQMGKVYKRLILATMQPDENYIDSMVRVYNNEICDILDNYNCGAYYEPSYFIARAYNNGGF